MLLLLGFHRARPENVLLNVFRKIYSWQSAACFVSELSCYWVKLGGVDTGHHVCLRPVSTFLCKRVNLSAVIRPMPRRICGNI